MGCIVNNEIKSLIRELRQLREVVAFQNGNDKAVNERLATKAMDPQLLQELELTTNFVRMLTLQKTMVCRSKPSSTVHDILQSVKMRQAVEELQRLRSAQRNLQPQRIAQENRVGVFQEIFQSANRICNNSQI